MQGGAGNDTLIGGDGYDNLYGGAGDDALNGGDGGGYLAGEAGNDALVGGIGNDQLAGGDGNDSHAPGAAGHDILEETNIGYAIYSAGANELTLGLSAADTYVVLTQGFEEIRLSGTSLGDMLNLSAFAGRNYLYGNAGDDVLKSGNGDYAYVSGGPGNDTLMAGNATQTQLSGDAGNDSLQGGGGTYNYLYGQDGDDSLVGGTATYSYLYGDAGDDVLKGGNGAYSDVRGGAGNDTLAARNATQSRLYGEAGNDGLQGGGGTYNYLYGQDGDDTLVGGNAKSSYLYGDAGNDELSGEGAKGNYFYGGAGSDGVTIFATSGADSIQIYSGYVYVNSMYNQYVDTERLTIDALGGRDTATQSGTLANLTIRNLLPLVTFSGGAINEGDTFQGTGSFSDLVSTGVTPAWSATVDYGDGTGEQSLALNADKTFSLNHTYADNGSYSVVVKVKDIDGDVGEATAAVAVSNIAPAIALSGNSIAYRGQASAPPPTPAQTRCRNILSRGATAQATPTLPAAM